MFIIAIILISILFCCLYCVSMIINFGEFSSDNTILHMLNTEKKNYNIATPKFILYTKSQNVSIWKNGTIIKLPHNVIFPYTIEGMGAIPFWYKSVKLLDSLFKERNKPNEK